MRVEGPSGAAGGLYCIGEIKCCCRPRGQESTFSCSGFFYTVTMNAQGVCICILPAFWATFYPSRYRTALPYIEGQSFGGPNSATARCFYSVCSDVSLISCFACQASLIGGNLRAGSDKLRMLVRGAIETKATRHPGKC